MKTLAILSAAFRTIHLDHVSSASWFAYVSAVAKAFFSVSFLFAASGALSLPVGVAPNLAMNGDNEFDNLLEQLAAEQYEVRERASATIKNRPITPDEFKRLLQTTKSRDLEQAERAILLVAEKIPEIAPSAGTLVRSIRNKNGIEVSRSGVATANIKVLLQNSSDPDKPILHSSPWVFDEAFAFNSSFVGVKPPNPTEIMLAEFAKRSAAVERALLRADTVQARAELEAWKQYLERVGGNVWAEAAFMKFDPVSGQGTKTLLKQSEAIGILQKTIDLIPKIDNEIQGKLEEQPEPVEEVQIFIAASGDVDVGRSFHFSSETLGAGGVLALQPRPFETGLLWTDGRTPVSEMPMFDLQVTEGLQLLGDITVGFSFSDTVPNLDELVIFRATEAAVYTLTPTIDFANHIAWASYIAPTDGSNQLGEFYLVAASAMPEPTPLALVLCGIAMLIRGRGVPAARKRVAGA